DRRPSGLRRRVDLRGGAGRHRGAPPPSGLRPVGQLAEGRPGRALPAALRAAHLSQEPLPEARADEARGVPAEGDQAADPAAARSRHLAEAERVRSPGRSAPGPAGAAPGPAAGPATGPVIGAALERLSADRAWRPKVAR